ncbi:MAG: hypothetical protein WEA04_00500 [Candidatus Andersenbacteria bacterium]
MIRFLKKPRLSPDTVALLLLLGLCLVANSMYLHRVPGLLGDEGSEGENVFNILDTKKLTVVGERSYIGPLIDYVRIPAVLLVGFNALSLRLIMLLATLVMFIVAASVLRKLFGTSASLYILTFLFFSPIYLLYQRLGWAITLIPLGIILMLWTWQQAWHKRSLVVGLLGGLSLSNHFIFLPSLVAVAAPFALGTLLKPHQAKQWLLAGVGFWAMFGTQFAVLSLAPEDQGDPSEVVSSVGERLAQLPTVLPGLLSGSAYSALYTGEPFPALSITLITVSLALLASLALLLSERRRYVLVWVLCTILQLVVLNLIIDRFAVRYFVIAVLSTWALAGYGFYAIIKRVAPSSVRLHGVLPVLIALGFITAAGVTTLQPYLKTGGSTAPVVLTPQRSEQAAAFVALDPLLACVRGAGPVFAEDIHIYNRLYYLQHSLNDLVVPLESSTARWLVAYREPQEMSPRADERCPDLAHFRVTPYVTTPDSIEE